MRRHLAIVLLWATSACGSPSFQASFLGGMGATPGGVKDIKFARALVDQGRVPPAAALVPEGLLSEHDLALDGPACQSTLCLQSAGGIAPTLAGKQAMWLQVGMSSDVNPDTYQRPNVTFILTVDVSGSMGWDLTGDDAHPTPAVLARRLLHRLTNQLHAGDRVAIVTYGTEVNVPLSVRSANNPDATHAVIDALHEDGSTDMEAGLQRAYALAASVHDGATQVRVLLFTDEQPNVGATTSDYFAGMVNKAAQSGVGTTVFGLGLGLGQELMNAMATLRDANAYSLITYQDVDALMANVWPFFCTPIANNLNLAVDGGAALQVTHAYGFPGGNGAAAKLQVQSVFLSRNSGALLVQLEACEGQDLTAATLRATLTYTDAQAGDLTYTSAHTLDPNAARTEPYFDQPQVAKTVALALLIDGMHRAAALYGDTYEQALDVMEQADARFHQDIANINDDPTLLREARFADALLDLMRAKAQQGDMYEPWDASQPVP